MPAGSSFRKGPAPLAAALRPRREAHRTGGLRTNGSRTTGSSAPALPPRSLAFVCRSIALFVILCQFRLAAKDLADTSFYITALLCAFAAAWILAKLKTPVLPAVCVLALAPWAVRLCAAAPRLFAPDAAIPLDSLLLNLDRNTFVALLPCYWAGFTSFFSLRSRKFLRGDVIAGGILLGALFCVIRGADLEFYRWPVLMIGVFAGVVFLQLLALILSLPPEIALRRGEGTAAALALLALVLIGGALLIRPSQEGAVDQGGGLLQPNLFQFDFSQILRLESEISMNEDLAMIVRKEPEDSHYLLRRFVLSGYSGKQGFYRHETIDERSHPQRLPNRKTLLVDSDAAREEMQRQNRGLTNQEYFLVNFDSSALVGMNEPGEVVPFESWDASSFSSAYGVQSFTSDALPFELIDAVQGPPSPETLGLSQEEYAYYTEYGGNEKLAAFAREITGGENTYWDKTRALYEHLKYGEYRYSLKPGIAPDGDQLGRFLFDAKKGYCSYFAFAMTLLLRSIGIPSRVAVGFFINSETSAFNYYPVQFNMAHAWVEVYYPGYGWIESDPTTPYLAEDEEFSFSSGVPQDLFERLMKEILDNRSRLTPKEGIDEKNASSDLARLGISAGRFIRDHIGLIAIIVLCAVFLLIRCGPLFSAALTGSWRKKTQRLYLHAKRRLSLAGFRRDRGAAEADWAKAIDQRFALGLYQLYMENAAARFAPEYGPQGYSAMKAAYRQFSVRYQASAALSRRLLAWALPPLALVLPRRAKSAAVLLLTVIVLFAQSAGTAEAQDAADIQDVPDADSLYRDASASQNAEFWERAIDLYTQGGELYPLDSRFPLALGALYYSRRLYGLAWDEYRKAEILLPDNIPLLYRLSRTAGHLNQDAVSAEYLERLLSIEPDNRDAIGSLGWMYYKLHRLDEGEALLSAALERFGSDPDYAMNLGTIYSDMFRYGDAKTWYLEAIAAGEDAGDREFTAIAHYNLALLESRFYKYADSFDRTSASLSVQNRASGRLARGELFLHQLNFSQVFAEYQRAYEIDTSALSKINLAQAYQMAGRLEEARLYAEDCLKAQDLSWMLNYGIDPVRYKRDIHDILRETYLGLAHTGGRRVYGTAGEWIRGHIQEQYYYLKAKVHELLFRKYSLISADAYQTEPDGGGPRLDALLQYYNAFEPYPRRAASYLARARDFEVSLIPEALGTYELEEGMLLKKPELAAASIARFDPVWERDMIADAYTELALRDKGEGRRSAAERLYALNRGALRQRGIILPVTLIINAEGGQNSSRAERALGRMLKRMGLVSAPESRFRFSITLSGASAVCELYDGGRGTVVFQRTADLASLDSQDVAAFAKTLGDWLFTAN